MSDRCVCGARTTYRLTRGSTELYRCAACSARYAAPEWRGELLPGYRNIETDDIYPHYRELRDRMPWVTTEAWATLPRFKDINALEQRYQREQQRARRTA